MCLHTLRNSWPSPYPQGTSLSPLSACGLQASALRRLRSLRPCFQGLPLQKTLFPARSHPLLARRIWPRSAIQGLSCRLWSYLEKRRVHHGLWIKVHHPETVGPYHLNVIFFCNLYYLLLAPCALLIYLFESGRNYDRARIFFLPHSSSTGATSVFFITITARSISFGTSSTLL